MSNNHRHSAQHGEVLKKQSLQQHEVKEVLNVFQKYAMPALIVVVIVCGIFLFDRYLKTSKANKEIKADAILMSAMGPDDFQKIIDDYDSTSSAPIALMSLAMSKFSDGDYDAAQELYAKFAKKYAKHAMALQAELNQITCKEAKGELGDASQLYADFAGKHKDSYLAPVALMGQARCLEGMENLAEAKQVYEDLMVAYPDCGWEGLAETRETVIETQLK